MSTTEPTSGPDIAGFLSAVRERDLEVHSLVVLRDGETIARHWWEPYRASSIQLVYSLSKSFTSTAIGLLVAEGKVALTDRVADFFPEAVPESANDHLRSLTLWHLLTMSVGRTTDSFGDMISRDQPWIKSFFQGDFQFPPGSRFLYDTGATYMAARILYRITGQTLTEYLEPRLFRPLGIDETEWLTDPEGVDIGGSGLHITTEAIAKLGQLYLQKGRWDGQQVVPAEWVAAATARQVDNSEFGAGDWAEGYGFQFWRCRHGFYRGDGAFGQLCLVMEAHDMVVALTSCVDDMQKLFDTCYEFLIPGDHPSSAPAGVALEVPRPRGDSAPDPALFGTYRGEGHSVRVNEHGLTIDGSEIPHRYRWHEFANDPWLRRRGRVAIAGAWPAPFEMRLRVQFLHEPASYQLVLTFDPQARTLTVTSTIRGVFIDPADATKVWEGRAD